MQTEEDSRILALVEARLHDPFALLGPRSDEHGCTVRAYRPEARLAWLETEAGAQPMRQIHPGGLFEWQGAIAPPSPYWLRIEQKGLIVRERDAYAFAPSLNPDDIYLFNSGRCYGAYQWLGAHPITLEGVSGVRFVVWAPNAERVSVIGDFNSWDGRIHPLQAQGSSGLWALFIPGIAPGNLYKFEIRSRSTGALLIKTDPYANEFEIRPSTAARVAGPSRYEWRDEAWLEARSRADWLHAPCSIYEIHLGSWRRRDDGSCFDYRELADRLVPYAVEMGYTHIELMPISEHPLDESWGYQTTGYFAPTSRYGAPDQLRYLIDSCHCAGIGVLLDWVPAHFPSDSFALARFDGTALYEHADPRLGVHQDWGTYIFNFGRNEVKSFLLSSAHYWLDQFHFDGLRVDAVASMLYLDYSRKEGEWLRNRHGGRENLEAIDFVRELNIMVHKRFSGALTFAEESTAWPMVSRPTYVGGLGFSMKWNMGWMNDTLRYFAHDAIHRRYHHNELTFGQLYAYTENFALPLSHDEVVHGKGSLLAKMPGDAWQKFANLRLLYTYQMTAPGKKLSFMGNEFAQGMEWSEQRGLDWDLLQYPAQQGMQALTRDLNHLYCSLPALHDQDFAQEGFEWIDCHDSDQSVLSFLRRARNGSFAVVVLNFTPVPRLNYRIGVPAAATYRVIFNGDSAYYWGSNLDTQVVLPTSAQQWMGRPAMLTLSLPPLAGIILTPCQQ